MKKKSYLKVFLVKYLFFFIGGLLGLACGFGLSSLCSPVRRHQTPTEEIGFGNSRPCVGELLQKKVAGIELVSDS